MQSPESKGMIAPEPPSGKSRRRSGWRQDGGLRPGLQKEVQTAGLPQARWHGFREYEEALFEVLPAEGGAQPYRRKFSLGKDPPDRPVLVV